eukprot:1866069-Rhodomonas_salina.1
MVICDTWYCGSVWCYAVHSTAVAYGAMRRVGLKLSDELARLKQQATPPISGTDTSRFQISQLEMERDAGQPRPRPQSFHKQKSTRRNKIAKILPFNR